jgi:lipopolysaccharide export system ATP-binding protein
MSLLQCQGLVKDYPGKRAVDGVDFHVDRGEIVGLLGPNGAGKTTTFRMACGMISPTEGTVLLDGVDVTRWPMYKRARHGMGYLPQDESIFVKLSVEQNILAILEYLGMKRKERLAATDRLLDQFGLSQKRKQIASTLSGGERRRLEIARCLASKPFLILLDEPFTGIDPVTIHSIQDIIADLRDEGISILLTDHRERETLTITDRSYIICAGNVVVSGDAETVLSNPSAQELYFGKRFDASSIIEGKEAFISGNDIPTIERPPEPAIQQPVQNPEDDSLAELASSSEEARAELAPTISADRLSPARRQEFDAARSAYALAGEPHSTQPAEAGELQSDAVDERPTDPLLAIEHDAGPSESDVPNEAQNPPGAPTDLKPDEALRRLLALSPHRHSNPQPFGEPPEQGAA